MYHNSECKLSHAGSAVLTFKCYTCTQSFLKLKNASASTETLKYFCPGLPSFVFLSSHICSHFTLTILESLITFLTAIYISCWCKFYHQSYYQKHNNIHLKILKLKLPRFSDPYIKYMTTYIPKNLSLYSKSQTIPTSNLLLHGLMARETLKKCF